MRVLPWFLLAVTFSVSYPVSAQEAGDKSPAVKAAEILCKEAPPKSALFPQLADAARQVRQVVCIKGGGRDEAAHAIVHFLDKEEGSGWFEPYGGFKGGSNPLWQALHDTDLTKGDIPAITPLLGRPGLSVNAATIFEPANLDKCEEESAKYKTTDGRPQDCRGALEDFRSIYTYVQQTYAAEGVLAFANSAESLNKEWDEFLFSSRSQTLLELVINSALYERKEGLNFSPPPAKQWIVLHPNLVVENVNDAADGDKTKEALMVEVAGVNYWQRKRWYIPSGASLIALYSDRAGATEMGYGVAVHFKSVYTIGYSNHSGSDGYFISVDLLKFFEDKKKVIDMFDP